jgi:IS1 family transposase
VFATDDWAGFYRFLPEERHFPGKDLTFPIEASDSDIRHPLAWFVRRPKFLQKPSYGPRQPQINLSSSR